MPTTLDLQKRDLYPDQESLFWKDNPEGISLDAGPCVKKVRHSTECDFAGVLSVISVRTGEKIPPGDPARRNICLLGKKLLPAGDKIYWSVSSPEAQNRKTEEIHKESTQNPKFPKNRGRNIAQAARSQQGGYLSPAYIKSIYRDIKGIAEKGWIKQRAEPQTISSSCPLFRSLRWASRMPTDLGRPYALDWREILRQISKTREPTGSPLRHFGRLYRLKTKAFLMSSNRELNQSP